MRKKAVTIVPAPAREPRRKTSPKPHRTMSSPSSSMQVTRAADYAVRVMIHLATQPENVRAALGTLSGATGVPESFLSKVLQGLARAGFVSSRRGQSGGFKIQPEGRQASMAAVIEAIEGSFRLNLCMWPGSSCDRKASCPAHPVWAETERAMLAVLRSYRMADLAAHAPSRQGPLVKL